MLKYKVALFSNCYGRKSFGGPAVRHYSLAKVLKYYKIPFHVYGFNPRQVHPDYQLEEAVGGMPNELNNYNIFWVEQGFNCIYELNTKGILPILGCNLIPNSGSMHVLPYLDEDGKKRQEQSIINEKKWMKELKGKFWCSQSYFQEKEYRRLGLPINERVYRINNPVDTDKFVYYISPNEDNFIVSWIGKQNWAKAPLFLKEIARRLPEIKFNYISNEDCNIEFSGNVTKLLHQENNSMPKLLNQSHLYISTSVTENQPLAGLEAMACRLPTIAFRTSGWPEIIKDNYNGILVDLGNIDHFIYEIQKLKNNERERLRLGSNARNYINNVFSFDACGKQLINLFDIYLKE